MSAMVDPGTLTVEAFERGKDEPFIASVADREIVLTLTEIQRLGQGHRDGEAFSLLFIAPPGPFFPQAIYALTHPTIGTTEIFLVPLGPRAGGNAYEAIFT